MQQLLFKLASLADCLYHAGVLDCRVDTGEFDLEALQMPCSTMGLVTV